MKDPLHSAEMALDTAYDIRNRDNYIGDRWSDAAYHVQRAQAYAAIALAEQLKCIADALQQIAVTLDLGTSPTAGRIPAALRGPHVDEDLPLWRPHWLHMNYEDFVKYLEELEAKRGVVWKNKP